MSSLRRYKNNNYDHPARLTNLALRRRRSSWTRVPFDLEKNYVGPRRATGPEVKQPLVPCQYFDMIAGTSTGG